jgi:hypothetical protein
MSLVICKMKLILMTFIKYLKEEMSTYFLKLSSSRMLRLVAFVRTDVVFRSVLLPSSDSQKSRS